MKSKIKSFTSILFFSFKTVRKKKSYLLVLLLSVLTDVVISLGLVIIPKYLIDSLSISNNGFQKTLIYVFAMCLLMLSSAVFPKLLNNVLSVMNYRIDRNLNEQLQDASLRMPFEMLETKEIQDNYTIAQEFISEITVSSIVNEVFSVLSALVKIISCIFIAFKCSWVFLIAILLSTIIEIVCKDKEQKEILKEQKRSATIQRRINYVSRNIMDYSYAKEIRIFGLGKFLFDKFDFYMKKMYSSEFASLRKLIPISIISTLTGVLLTFTAYGTVGYGLLLNNYSVGTFVEYAESFILLGSSVTALFSSVVTLINRDEYLKCFLDFIKKSELTEKPEYASNIIHFSRIDFVNVFFKYPNSEKYAIKNLNLTINSGEKIAIVGKNGAGKSTLIKLLLKLYTPEKGTILIDGIDINSIPNEEYWRLLSVAYQDGSIFSYSVKENIAFNQELDSSRINRILTDIDLFDSVNKKKHGFDTYITRTIDNEGADFSGGEKKKIIISRALYKEAGLYILDEPTSDLSAKSEKSLYNAIFNSSYVKSVIFITHRLSSCKRCDRIIVLNDGYIVGDGNHSKLINDCKLYTELFNTQAKMYQEGV